MGRDWDITLSYWGEGPSATEREKCDRSERAVRKAIADSRVLNAMEIEVFAQGSFANRTDVRADSDVDVCVLYKGTFYSDFSHMPGLTDAIMGFESASYSYASFKNDVQTALVSYFGSGHIRRGNKAFDIRENTYRIDADVVPCFEHRLWHGKGEDEYRSGTQFISDDGHAVINWPQQNYENGVEKNGSSGTRFKSITRVLKNLRYELLEEGQEIADRIPSFLLECLVWNVPDEDLMLGTISDGVRAALAHLWNETRASDTCNEWTEVNDVKYLFRETQPWKRADVNNFLQTCWDYLGFE